MFQMFRPSERKRRARQRIYRAFPTDPEALVSAIGPYVLEEMAGWEPIPGVRKIGLVAFHKLRSEWARYLGVSEKRGFGKPLRCSFCGKTQDEVNKLIVGPSVTDGRLIFVCNECVALCNDILAQENSPNQTGDGSPSADPSN